MTYFLFLIKSALEDFRRNKLRTFLTSLGILIGVASVVLLLAFGLGLKKYIQDQFESLGTNLIFIIPGKFSASSGGRQGAGGASFDQRDVTSLKKIRDIQYVAPLFTKTVTIKSQTNTEVSSIMGSSEEVFPTLNIGAEYGDIFIKTDVDKRSKIAVIGPNLAKKLYSDPANALGQLISIEDQKFKVVGVTISKGGGGFGGPSFDDYVFLPYKSIYSLNPQKTFYAIYVKGFSGINVVDVKDEINTTLLKRYKADDFSVVQQTEILNTVSSIFAILNSILVAIAAISLIVGGIGIMNIMYVSVVERTREIGIRRAIGATSKDILMQFLLEAVILSILGGSLGLLFSFGIVLIVDNFFPAYIDLNSVLIALGVSSLIGITFGVFPARKAANLSPIDAIRYE